MNAYEVKDYNGTAAIFENGRPLPALMHWTRNPSREDTEFFRDAGIHFYSFMGNLCIPAPEGTPEADLIIADGGLERMLLTPENIDQTMTMLTQCDPEIRILPRIIMNPPLWWEKAHPDELMVYYHFDRQALERGPRASLASELWNRTWQKYLAGTVRYFEEKWGSFILGYHTGLGHCGEHTYFWWDHAADFCKKHGKAFALWLERKYHHVENLNRVWKTEYKSFADDLLPNPVRFHDCGVRSNAIFLPESEFQLIDFQYFASDLMADTVIAEAQCVKRTLQSLKRRKLFGAFYGYVNLVGNSSQTTCGHSALTKILDCPEIDFLCGPLSYGGRQNGGCVLSQMIPGSIALHGKIFYNEDDTGTHVVQRDHHGYIPDTAAESVHAERRNFLETLRTGGTQWWMDLYGCGWFLDPALQKEFRSLKEFGDRHFQNRRSNAQCAVFVSPESSLYMRDNPVSLTGNLIEQQLFEIAAMGASFDIYQDTDIPLLARQEKLEQYRFCIFVNSLAMSGEIRESVKKHLQNNDRTLLWFYAPGYVRGHERSEQFSGELTGIRFHTLESGIMPMLTESWIGKERFRISYGLTRAVYPRLCANDPDAEILGYFVNGTTIAGRTNGPGAALVQKEFADWKSIWSASPELPSCMLTQFAEAAGVHVYSRRGDQILTGEGWFGIHCKQSGKLVIPFPGRFRYRNAETGETYPEGDTLTLKNTRRGETYLFEIFPQNRESQTFIFS